MRPDAFRGPGFSVSETTLRVLLRRGYRYDASTFPTFLGPLARAYYFMTAKLDAEEKRKRAKLFGSRARRAATAASPTAGSCPKASCSRCRSRTLPVFRVPIHLSYVLYLSAFSPLAGASLLRAARCGCAA